ncbi:sulfotransferase family protein [Salininema proteolyticum]|uniref:Sulfotransferase family protein n=1 Tax=Salininema proteolyticum TaxID=1607685 RepID=A0ABV8TYR0_9ACTN
MSKTIREIIPAPVRQAISSTSRTYGRVTSGHRLLPSFLLCGGQRCGTTSLYRALSQHPAVLKPNLHKGVHYFDTAYHKGPAWYRGHFPTRATAKRVQDQTGLSAQAFESSPYYLYHPLAAGRIAADLPGAKVIVLVRDPVERAWSQHAHELARGFETESDFTSALSLEPERLHGQDDLLAADPRHYSFCHQHHAYRARGQYADHLDRFAETLGAERVLAVDSGRFFARPEETFERILRFLGLPWIGSVEFKRHNGRGRPSPLRDDVRAELEAHYEPYDERLTAWLGHEPSWRGGE